VNTDTPKMFRDAMRPIAREIRRWRVGEIQDRELTLSELALVTAGTLTALDLLIPRPANVHLH